VQLPVLTYELEHAPDWGDDSPQTGVEVVVRLEGLVVARVPAVDYVSDCAVEDRPELHAEMIADTLRPYFARLFAPLE
jgi:hypothetical protein